MSEPNKPTPAYHFRDGDHDRWAAVLVGPDGWECCLGEPEDCNWSRDGRDAMDRLNAQHAEIARLTAERDAAIAHRAATNEEIKSLHAMIKRKGFCVEDSVSLNVFRDEVVRLTADRDAARSERDAWVLTATNLLADRDEWKRRAIERGWEDRR